MKEMTEGADQLAAPVCSVTRRPSGERMKVEGNWWSCMEAGISSSAVT